jgi:hypothetical protein
MKIIIDACCLSNVFDRSCKEHADFAPLLACIAYGKGRMTYGGTKYRKELRKVLNALPLITELARAKRIAEVNDAEVDKVAADLKGKFDDPKFNDEHLVAIVVVSACHVVCTRDKVAITYLKNAKVFRNYKVKRPKIYRSRRNEDLFSRRHFA